MNQENINQEKLNKLKMSAGQVRIGGKGSARRKRKVVHKTATTDDKKLQATLKKLQTNSIPGIEEVNMIRDDGTVIHFNNPKVQASLTANTFAITGHGEIKKLTDMLPGIISQLGVDSTATLKSLADSMPGIQESAPLVRKAEEIDEDDEDVPDLVENFDAPSKEED